MSQYYLPPPSYLLTHSINRKINIRRITSTDDQEDQKQILNEIKISLINNNKYT